MKVTRTRLTEDEKKAWRQFCQASHASESEMLKMMIRKVSGSVSHTSARNAEPKSEKVTVRLAPGDFKKMDGRAQEEGYLSRTSWTTAVVLAALYREPVLTNEEVNALRQSCRELGAIGRNLNQVARALNIEFREGDRIKREAIEDLAERIEEHRALVFELLNKNMNRWRQ
ncbi:plasmid mobilization relaxosome protein MobC [Pistricoccus aurantiacus]|uniref:plasmid mobilization relaxosome protein MobC n=1 Tax=Pistricoccus aurantiacus TaxID=1883414 RepID=UPI00363EFB4E